MGRGVTASKCSDQSSVFAAVFRRELWDHGKDKAMLWDSGANLRR